MHLRILWVGKTKNRPMRSLTEDYAGRVHRLLPCTVVELPDPARKKGFRGRTLCEAEALIITSALAPGFRQVALDEKGRQLSSVEFAHWFETEQNRGTKGLDFVIGGPAGLSPSVLDRAHLRLSLGRMTWTHEMSRVLLLEQIYRAQCIVRKIPYHK
jgi:23S rRNA (pseudouridine1915-N3)-methyltransferase